jgi:autotransporter adhesin
MKKVVAPLLLLICNYSFAQNVGIGTTDPKARLHVADSNILFSSPAILPANPGNAPVSGTGNRMMWYADKAALRAGGVDGMGWDKIFTGNYSVALGYNNIASGMYAVALNSNTRAAANFSTALGYATAANANGSTALGSLTIANGENSISSGYFSEANGKFSFATGFHSQAKAFGSFTLGNLNDITDNPDPLVSAATDRIFQVGNGTSSLRSNALTILQNGNVGIGTAQPVSALHVANKSVLYSIPNILPSTPADPPLSGGGNRMMWYADKAAFRAGGAYFSEWDKNSIGTYSVAIGYSVTAIGPSSVAMGESNYAGGNASVAMGYSSIATGQQSVAMGQGAQASGATSFASGLITEASGNYSFTSGYGTKAKAAGGFTTGIYNDENDNPNATVPGPNDRIFQVGNGVDFTSRSNAVTILRNGNTGIGVLSPSSKLDVAGGNNWDLTNNEGDFRIGNAAYRIKMGVALGGGGAGAGVIRASGGINVLALGAGNINLITMNGNTGNVGIGVDNPTQKLHVAGNILATGTITPSDRRYKEDIQLIADPLQKLQQINGVTYHYKPNEFPGIGFDSTPQVGVIAQEVETVLPQVVVTDANGYKAVDYSKIVPLLIESIKEQQRQIEELKKIINKNPGK